MKIKTKIFKWNELKRKSEVVVSYIDTTKLMTKDQVRIKQLKKEKI
jgi:hypothetical protein